VCLLEVTSAVLVVAAGVSEAFAGNWYMLNLVVLMAHAYYNVGVRIKKEWKIFLLRKVPFKQPFSLVQFELALLISIIKKRQY